MVSAFERIVIAVPGLEDAGEQYQRLLGVEAAVPGAGPDRAGMGWSYAVLSHRQLEHAVLGVGGRIVTGPLTLGRI